MEFNREDLQELNTLADRMEALFDSLENTFEEWRDFCRAKKQLENETIEANFQKLIDKGLIPGVYFKKFDSEDIFQIKGIGNGFYVAVNATAGDGKTYRMPLEHYITGESLADKYEPCEAPNK
jgi:hypothetical protein